MPGNIGSFVSSLRIRLFRSSSLTERDRKPDARSSPRVVARSTGTLDGPCCTGFAIVLRLLAGRLSDLSLARVNRLNGWVRGPHGSGNAATHVPHRDHAEPSRLETRHQIVEYP